jgi:transitional endoplasmic reticulum ATPase
VAARGLGILLFDELEDLFSSRGLFGTFGDDLFESRGPPSVSKQWVNMLLESNAVPTIWIANSVAAMEHSFLRRFTYVIELGDFTAGQRRRAWQRHLQPADDVSADDLEALVQRFELSPAHISSAVRAARLMSPTALKRPVLEAVLEPAMKLRHGSRPAAIAFEPHRYLLEVVNTPVDLEALARKLASWTPGSGKGLTLCFHGPSGTGKSELARYLAHRMERPLVVRRGSDIISCWVGATEQNISRAFRQAHQDGAVLLFDEADSFLRNRRGAIRSWEVTHVNEFLQQLELFPGAVICTTNRFEDLDPAVHRRFLFKIPFGYLLPEQSTFLFRRTLEALGAPATGDLTALAAMAAFDTLAPGDFDAVERRLRVMGAKPTAKELLDELRQEIEVKRGVQETGTPSQFDARRSGMT